MPMVEDTSLAQRPYLALGTMLLATAVTWCIWSATASRRLKIRVDAINQQRQPLFTGDFAMPDLPDAENAAVTWSLAFSAAQGDTTAPTNSNLTWHLNPPYTPAWCQSAASSEASNQLVLSRSHTAAAIKTVHWKAGSAPFYTPMSHYNAARSTAAILADSILYNHCKNNDATAIGRVCDLYQLAEAQGQDTTLIGRLVAVSICAELCDRIEVISPDLAIGSTAGGAPRPSVELLIRNLLDEDQEPLRRQTAVDRDRCDCHQFAAVERKQRWVLTPIVDLADAKMLDQRRIDRLAAGASSWTRALQIYKADPKSAAAVASLDSGGGYVGFEGLYGDHGVSPTCRYLNTEWRGIAERRVAAISLAILLWRCDHDGAWPRSISELVPRYLPGVPEDPFQNSGTSIGYVIRTDSLSGGRARPMLVFGMKGNPSTAPLPPAPLFGWYNSGPQWRDLSRWYPSIESAN